MTHENNQEHSWMLGSHESGVRRLFADSQGLSYHAFKTLAAAQAAPDGTVVLDGDWGGQIYVTCPARLVRCTEETLQRLLLDIDAICWPGQPDGAGLSYEQVSVGTGVAGGMGGGIALDEVWVHKELVGLGLAPAIKAVLSGERASITDPD